MSVKTNTCNIVSKKFTSHNCRSYDTATYHAIAVAGYFTIKPDKKKVHWMQIYDTIADSTTDVTSDFTTKPDQKVADNDNC